MSITFTGDGVELFSTLVGLLISIVAVVISILSLKQTQKSIEEANRAYVVVYRDYIQVNLAVHEYIIVKNFGKTGAIIDSIEFYPEYKDSFQEKVIFKNIKGTFIAPNQSISTVSSNNAFYGEREGLIKVTVKYHSDNKDYIERLTLNEDLIKDLNLSKTSVGKSTRLETVVAKTTEELLRRNL
ncbi:hypothetical protein ACQKKE_05310 [Desemzia incerta]|uniref:hypothetical protein n=1 Tax=Desemzia incerta TaxID=82801 RepID=UPI003CFEDD88